jgi:hypothetical protein
MNKKITIEELKAGISALLDSHSGLSPMISIRIAGDEPVKMRRFTFKGGEGAVAMEHNLKTQVNLWVRRNGIRLDRLKDVTHRIKPASTDGNPGRHSNLEQISSFKGETLVCFTPETLWQAARILHEAAGAGYSK